MNAIRWTRSSAPQQLNYKNKLAHSELKHCQRHNGPRSWIIKFKLPSPTRPPPSQQQPSPPQMHFQRTLPVKSFTFRDYHYIFLYQPQQKHWAEGKRQKDFFLLSFLSFKRILMTKFDIIINRRRLIWHLDLTRNFGTCAHICAWRLGGNWLSLVLAISTKNEIYSKQKMQKPSEQWAYSTCAVGDDDENDD